jgi:murein DD-endopeptidase MepM/ murein hydrolase activator NlpD
VRAALLLGLLALAAPLAHAAPLPGSLAPPVGAACISSPFGPRDLPGTRASHFHTGIDFPAAPGIWVVAVAAGRIAQIRRLGSDGLEVDVRHADAAGGFVTRYAHLGSVSPDLARGRSMVAAGQRLGRVGRTGITYGTHVHFEVRIAGEPVDPEPFFHVARCHRPVPSAAGSRR